MNTLGIIYAAITVLAWGTWLAPSQNVKMKGQQTRTFYVTLAVFIMALVLALVKGFDGLNKATFWFPFIGGLIWALSGWSAFIGTRGIGMAKAFGIWAPMNIVVSIFSEVMPDMDIAKEEIFGPVLSIIRFKTREEAVKIATSTVYGLSASVWTKDIDIAMIMSRKIEAGTVWINNFMSGYPEVSFGGFKQSGLGRELGRFSIDEFSELKSVLIHLGPSGSKWVS